MNTGKQLSKLTNLDLTHLLTSAGQTPIDKLEYKQQERKAIKYELVRYATAKQEPIPEAVIDEWIETFQELRISPLELVCRIKVAKLRKRYGNQTTIADFTDIEDFWKEYGNHYKHVQTPMLPQNASPEPPISLHEFKEKNREAF